MKEDQEIRLKCLEFASHLCTNGQYRLYPDFVWISEMADLFASYVKTGKVVMEHHWIRDHVCYPEGATTVKEIMGEYCYGDNEFEK